MDSYSYSSIIEKIKETRKEKGYSQSDFAQKLGLNKVAYNRIETGKTSLTLERFIEIVNILGMVFIVDNSPELMQAKLDAEKSRSLDYSQRLKQIESQLDDYKLFVTLLKNSRNKGENTYIQAGDDYLKSVVDKMDAREQELFEIIKNNPGIRAMLEAGENANIKLLEVYNDYFRK